MKTSALDAVSMKCLCYHFCVGSCYLNMYFSLNYFKIISKVTKKYLLDNFFFLIPGGVSVTRETYCQACYSFFYVICFTFLKYFIHSVISIFIAEFWLNLCKNEFDSSCIWHSKTSFNLWLWMIIKKLDYPRTVPCTHHLRALEFGFKTCWRVNPKYKARL